MSNDPESSIRSSTLTPLSEASHTVNIHSPTTPTPADSVSNRRTELPPRPHPERTSRLPLMPELTAKASGVSNAELQDLITEMQHSFQQQLQQQLQQQQRDFENRIESLMIGKGKAPEFSLPSIEKVSASSPPTMPTNQQEHVEGPIEDTHFGIASNEPIEPTDGGSRFPRARNSHQGLGLTEIRGNKGEDVEVWIEQVSAIFDSNRCSNEDIVALLSVILKDTALKWFTRLGQKGRAKFPTWMDWQEGLRQRFLQANYLAEKKRLWKKRDLRANEDMADYFDAKVDLQAYVFDEDTPEIELILDILEGLPEYMLPTLKSSITADMDLSDFRRILLDYEKGLR
ncbi:hypothetical protein NliqN6_1572 [Naganishia liquefaciens]|uniref:Retrotransposon gag domain-containing protein n=1 Tax=Naganishia liquefaciens TaxID=104408 RepID=A0A8H3TRB3_9TREE|nr:hypothetical protein NliqN6_1572 [Naganishia liquefaciens]